MTARSCWEQEDLGGDEEGGGAITVPQTGYLELKDSAGHAEMAIVSAEEVGVASVQLGRVDSTPSGEGKVERFSEYCTRVHPQDTVPEYIHLVRRMPQVLNLYVAVFCSRRFYPRLDSIGLLLVL